jgi:acyl carrier protein
LVSAQASSSVHRSWFCRNIAASRHSKEKFADPNRSLRFDNPHRTARRLQEKEPSMASNEEILAGLAEIVNEETGLAPEAVELDKSFTDDLDIDSISMMTIVVNAEEKFGVRIPDEEVKNLKTVGDAVDFIARAQA